MAARLYDVNDGTRPISVQWSIKGYHAFHIRPHPLITLMVEPEYGNQFDPHAMKVSMPPLDTIDPIYYDEATNMSIPHQTVRRIAGQQIGRVPANLCRAFRLLLNRGYVHEHHITAVFQGDVGPSRNPPVHQRYAPRAIGFDIPGGGADLSCLYELRIQRRHFRQAMHVFEECLPAADLERIAA